MRGNEPEAAVEACRRSLRGLRMRGNEELDTPPDVSQPNGYDPHEG